MCNQNGDLRTTYQIVIIQNGWGKRLAIRGYCKSPFFISGRFVSWVAVFPFYPFTFFIMVQLQRIGKDKVINHHHEVPYKVLNKSYTFWEENSWNKIIHWDNLIALKSLLLQYEWKIDCIYIDPPYNTGNEWWAYNDNVNDPRIKKWLNETVWKEWEDLSRHDKWLCMMYPRLKLLHKLLSDKGAIFVSIDEHEHVNLLCIMNEIFWESNYIDSIVWDKKAWAKWVPPKNMMVNVHEYIVAYAKTDKFKFIWEKRTAESWWFKNPDNDPRWPRRVSNIKSTTKPIEQAFTIRNPDTGKEYTNTRAFSKESLEKMIQEKRILRKESLPKQKEFLYEMTNENKAIKSNRWVFDAQSTTMYLKKLIPEIHFDNPKPISLMKYLLWVSTDKNAIILDCFAWSWTTAHATLELNKEDLWNRKFILVELLDYAEKLTAKRVKWVIDWFDKTEWTWWGFDFYELWEPLFIDSETLNENVWEEILRDYIRYSETKSEIQKRNLDNKYYLGTNFDTDYYFYYEKEKITELNYDFLANIKKEKNHWLIIYADICSLSDEFMKKNNIVFKKIPRDISQF